MKTDIKVTTFSNDQRWLTPVVDINSAEFMYSAITPKLAGIQYAESCTKREEIKSLCDEIADKIFELYKIMNDETTRN